MSSRNVCTTVPRSYSSPALLALRVCHAIKNEQTRGIDDCASLISYTVFRNLSAARAPFDPWSCILTVYLTNFCSVRVALNRWAFHVPSSALLMTPFTKIEGGGWQKLIEISLWGVSVALNLRGLAGKEFAISWTSVPFWHHVEVDHLWGLYAVIRKEVWLISLRTWHPWSSLFYLASC